MSALLETIQEEMLSHAPVGILVLDNSARITWINQSLLSFLHIDAKEIEGKSSDELDKPQLQLLFQEQETIYVPATAERKERWLKCSCGQLDNGGRVHYYYDVTDQYHLEKECQRLETIIEEISTADIPTGLINRRGIMQRLEPQVARCRRYGTELSLIALELGSEKPLSDDGLIALARSLRDYVRWADTVGVDDNGRYILILPETSMKGAEELAARIRVDIPNMELPDQQAGTLACRLGISSWKKNDTAAGLIEQAQAELH